MVGSSWVTIYVGRVGSQNLDPRATLVALGAYLNALPAEAGAALRASEDRFTNFVPVYSLSSRNIWLI